MTAVATARRRVRVGLRPDQEARAEELAKLWYARRKDVNLFAEYALKDAQGTSWVQQPFHREWHSLLPMKGPARVLIGAPRESAKSSQMSMARILWELGKDPNLRVKVVGASDDLATALVGEIATNIERNEKVREIFPDLKPDYKAGWSRTRLFVQRDSIQKDPSVEAAGVLSTGVGGRADLLIFDDVVDFRNAIAQPALREQVKRVVREVWTNLLGPDGRAVYVATVWHLADLTCELRESPEWTTWWKPAMHAETGELLWPTKWTREALDARLREIGPRSFARQFLLQPLSDEESTFPERILQVGLDLGRQYEPEKVTVPPDWPRFVGIDLASSMGQKAAYTVAFLIAVDPEGRRYPLRIDRARMQFDETVGLVGELWQRYRPLVIRVENNAYQQALLQHLSSRYPGIPLEPHTTGRNKADEKVGLPGLSATIANGGWVIPSGGAGHPMDCLCAWCAWTGELRGHPVAAHSDTVMAMWFADGAAGTMTATAAGSQRWADSFVVAADWR